MCLISKTSSGETAIRTPDTFASETKSLTTRPPQLHAGELIQIYDACYYSRVNIGIVLRLY